MINLKQLRTQKGITQEKLAKCIGISRSTIAMYETGGSEPDLQTLTKIAEFFNTTTDNLLGKITPTNKAKKIPVLGTIPAGIPIEAIEEILDYEEISEEMALRGEYFALKVKGDSMLPTIKNGDVVIVRQQDDAESGKICVVMINGYDATLKEIKKDPNGIWILPHNSNNEFKPTFYTNQEILDTPVRIIGVAVEIRRSL
ncbi:MAG: helix-turn-helix domain-containing protein [Clostridia bacterium]|nr:helix-turn-helix domain-containing protein [Clostridia bacterium]